MEEQCRRDKLSRGALESSLELGEVFHRASREHGGRVVVFVESAEREGILARLFVAVHSPLVVCGRGSQRRLRMLRMRLFNELENALAALVLKEILRGRGDFAAVLLLRQQLSSGLGCGGLFLCFFVIIIHVPLLSSWQCH